MTIYDYVNLINDNENIVYTLFDCDKGDLISVDTEDCDGKTILNIDELCDSEYADYEIGGIDMWIDDGSKIHIEFNIDVEDEDE